MALVTVLVEVERVKMAVVCRSADTVGHSPPVVKVQLKEGGL